MNERTNSQIRPATCGWSNLFLWPTSVTLKWPKLIERPNIKVLQRTFKRCLQFLKPRKGPKVMERCHAKIHHKKRRYSNFCYSILRDQEVWTAYVLVSWFSGAKIKKQSQMWRKFDSRFLIFVYPPKITRIKNQTLELCFFNNIKNQRTGFCFVSWFLIFLHFQLLIYQRVPVKFAKLLNFDSRILFCCENNKNQKSKAWNLILDKISKIKKRDFVVVSWFLIFLPLSSENYHRVHGHGSHTVSNCIKKPWISRHLGRIAV